MILLFLKYYYDTTKINVIISVGIGIISESTKGVAICLGTFGTLISFIIYSNFKKEQYYFYLNQGYTKTELMFKVFTINFLIAALLFIIIR
jgi:hypothetical protein